MANGKWRCANCKALVRGEAEQHARVRYERRVDGSGWDAFCNSCGELAHAPKKAKASRPTGQCSGKRGRCAIKADRVDPETGSPVCHVHDPNGKFQQNRVGGPKA